MKTSLIKVVGHINPQHLQNLEKYEVEWKKRKADRKYMQSLKKESIKNSQGGFTTYQK